jgi:hypothetical protein
MFGSIVVSATRELEEETNVVSDITNETYKPQQR